ncbi:MAG: type II toxin-antitoxin system VapC family toxin [Leptospira sp.]|nr:type II toxin-antitoxin system VapC family toxin [Leptospira sp.]
MILLDTHALLFWIKEDPILPKKRIADLEKFGRDKVFFCSLSFWEIYIKEKKGKLILGESSESFTKKVVGSGKITIVDSSWKDFLLASQFSWNHSDPVDRTLVAIAKNKNLHLLSKDSEIKKFYKKTIWN